PTDSADLVVSDAFSNLSVPWHLTTTEFVGDVQRVLRPDGLYLLNLIDRGNLRFVRAELRTLEDHFAHVALVSPGGALGGSYASNFVLVASDAPLQDDAVRQLVGAHGNELVTGSQLQDVISGAPVITDDFAPIDQWLAQDRP